MIRRPLEKILVQALVLTAIGGLYGHTMAQDSPFDQPTANEVDNPFSETNNNTADSPTSTDGETVNDPFASTTQPSDSPFAPTFGEDNSTGNTPAANAVDNPFASAGTGSTPAAPDSPFGEETAGATDPFGGNAAAAPDSPFGGNNAGAGNPFGGTADGATDPFGGHLPPLPLVHQNSPQEQHQILLAEALPATPLEGALIHLVALLGATNQRVRWEPALESPTSMSSVTKKYVAGISLRWLPANA